MSGRYRTIVADPPWSYEGFATAPQGERNRGLKPKKAALPYADLELAVIRGLPIASLAANDSRLFLWATNRYLRDAFGVVDAWGFQYVQALVWHKTGNPSPFGGSVAPIHAEFLLVAKRGSIEVLDRWPSSVIAANKPRDEHSRKPDVFLDLVERVSPGPYVELFARRARFGWDYWGDESLGTADMDAA
jgi:N6-adenosine-specific RNA methylase IME4